MAIYRKDFAKQISQIWTVSVSDLIYVIYYYGVNAMCTSRWSMFCNAHRFHMVYNIQRELCDEGFYCIFSHMNDVIHSCLFAFCPVPILANVSPQT